MGRLGIFHAVFGGLKLDASGLVSGMLAWSLDILIGKSVLEQSKFLMTTIPCQRHDQMHPTFSFQSQIS